MKRKIIAICNRSNTSEEEGSVVALADDGTLWEGWSERFCIADERTGSDGKKVAAKFEWRFVWHPLPALPDDNANLTKVTP